MRTPPILMGVALLFWAWQVNLPLAGVLMGLILEASRVVRVRWKFSSDDFRRIWSFCALVLLCAAAYSFSANEGPSGFSELFQNPNLATQRQATVATARTAAALLRWLPIFLLPFVAAQVYSLEAYVPLESVSFILQRRFRRARKLGLPPPPSRKVDVSYPYFALTLFSAGVHSSTQSAYFWGLCGLLAWALGWGRPRRFRLAIWGSCFAMAVVIGYGTQIGLRQLQLYLENLNPQFFLAGGGQSRFDPNRNQTMLGQVGRVKASSEIVIRLDVSGGGRAPALLREASYRSYKSQAWYAANGPTTLNEIRAETNETSWVLLPGKAPSARVNIGCYLSLGKALLPLPHGTVRLEHLPAFSLHPNPNGSVLAQGPELVLFDAFYGPGPSLDAAPDERDLLDVPSNEAPALEEIVTRLGLRGMSLEDARSALGRYFQTNFTYSTWQDLPRFYRTNETALSRFLTRTHSGHCEYFATATTLLLRQAGFHARYAVGYCVHEPRGHDRYVVRCRDAHAWCLLWNPATEVWEDLDTTPGSWLAAEPRNPEGLQWIKDAWSRLKYEVSRFRWGQSRAREYILWATIPVLLVLLWQVIASTRRKHHRLPSPAPPVRLWPGQDSEFYRVERELARLGVPRQADEPIGLWLLRATHHPSVARHQADLQRLLNLHYRYRFDPDGLSAGERNALREQVAGLSQSLRGRAGSARAF